MDQDTILCKLFKVHTYEELCNNDKHRIEKCSICSKYKVRHKQYNITSIYKNNQLPKAIKKELKNSLYV